MCSNPKKITEYLISIDTDIRSAIKQLEVSGVDSLIVENNDKVIGLFTIGDFRRAVLKGLDINQDLSMVVNKDYIYLKESYSIEEAKKIFIKNELILDIPIVNKTGRLLDIVSRKDCFSDGELNNNVNIKDVPVVIMAGGKGKRMDPFTRVLPKPLIPLGNEPIIKIIIENFSKYKANKFYVSVNDKEWMIKAYFHDHEFPFEVKYLAEDKPLGTAGALAQLKTKDYQHVFVSNCDVIVNADYASIYKNHIEEKRDLTIVGCMKQYTIPYGVCNVSANGSLESMSEKPKYDFLVNTGLYLINENVLNLIPDNTYFDMDSLINETMSKGLNIGVFPVSDKSWMDVGQWSEYSKTLNAII